MKCDWDARDIHLDVASANEGHSHNYLCGSEKIYIYTYINILTWKGIVMLVVPYTTVVNVKVLKYLEVRNKQVLKQVKVRKV